VAKTSKGVTGGSDALDGGGIEGGNRADTGAGLLVLETGVRISVHRRGDEKVLGAEETSLTALLAEERPDK
jgi:hypothetical protein